MFAGLLLVGFVTYQEYSGYKNSEEEKAPALEKDESVAVTISTEQVISGTIIYFVIFAGVASFIF